MLSRILQKQARNKLMVAQRMRYFSSDVTATEEAPKQQTSVEEHNKNVGADITFSEQKHGYVLTFPWNFEEVIAEFESDYKVMPESSYWHKFMVNTRSIVDFNNLFRDFHQSCALPDKKGLAKVCEPRLADYVGNSLDRIHFHGLDVEMANLTIEQPSIKVMKAEVYQGLNLDRSQNASSVKDYSVSANHNLFGAKWNTY